MFILKSLKIGKIRIFYYIPFEQNDVLQQLISAAAQTANEMRNLSGSLGFAVRNADGTVHFTEIAKFYQDTVDNAINGIANDVFDYNTAIKKAVSALTNSGLRTVDYTKYEALQRQRRLETKMRAQRQEIHLLEVGGASEDDIIAARCRYRVTSGEYTRFSKAMDLPQQRERVTVDGLGNVRVGKWKKKVDISGESDIIKKEKILISKKISNGELPLYLNKGNQNKHIPSSHSYKKEDKKSILYGDLDVATELINKYHGTGEFRFSKDNKWTNKEFVEVDCDIGEVYDEETDAFVPTNRFAIHYGKHGTHIVPVRRVKHEAI